MGLKSTIYKVTLNVADMDRNYYQEHQLTIAKHPSETDERLMLRVLAFGMYAHEKLLFGLDIGDSDEPSLWQKNHSGEIEQWIELGTPDERELRKACGRSKQVVLMSYGRRSTLDQWWQQNQEALKDKANLTILYIEAETLKQLAALAQRSLELSCNIQEKLVSLGDGNTTVEVLPVIIKPPQ